MTASSGGVTGTASVTVTSTPADFSLSVSPTSQSVKRGGTATYTVTISPTNGFTGSVTLSLTGQPSGATVTFTPNPATGHVDAHDQDADDDLAAEVLDDHQGRQRQPESHQGRVVDRDEVGRSRGLRIMFEAYPSDLRTRADNGDADAADELIELAMERNDLALLRHFADRGNATATDQLIELAAERGDMDELRRLADAGSLMRPTS